MDNEYNSRRELGFHFVIIDQEGITCIEALDSYMINSIVIEQVSIRATFVIWKSLYCKFLVDQKPTMVILDLGNSS